MSTEKCAHCEKRGHFDPCGCGSKLLGCNKTACCGDCQKAHPLLAKVFGLLLDSKQSTRVDSVRGKLFSTLHETLCYLECRAAIDYLRPTSGFDENQSNFEACVKRAIPLLPLGNALLTGWAARITTREVERKLQLMTDAIAASLAKQNQREELARSLESVFHELGAEVRRQALHDALSRI